MYEYTISKDDILQIYANRFLKDVLVSWCRCKTNVVIPSYWHAILWNNSNRKACANTIMLANLFHNGIKVFKDTTKKVYPYRRLREIYNMLEGDFLKYILKFDT